MVNIKFIKARKIKTLLSNKRNEKPLEFTEVKKDEESQAEYHETLYSVDEPETFSEDYDPLLVHDLIGIQQTIDTIDQPVDRPLDTDLEKKVDYLLANKPVKKTKRKPANVIYVVSRPQPGQVRGDWAVRSHGKIFTHHRTKQAAISKAREIARKKNATVLVQNTDGTFGDGFKPRPKKS